MCLRPHLTPVKVQCHVISRRGDAPLAKIRCIPFPSSPIMSIIARIPCVKSFDILDERYFERMDQVY